jgi:hypothetical protein
MRLKNSGFMKKYFLMLTAALLFTACDVLQDIVEVANEEIGDVPLTEQEVVKGLKEALRVGTDTAVSVVSVVNGYYGDQLLKISLPPEAKLIMEHKDHPLLKAAGLSKMIDDVILRMNRSAENAAKSAAPIFVNAITSMSIKDAFDILNGSDTAATHYFRQKTYKQLKNSFKPQIKTSLDKSLVGNVSANKAWSALTGAYNDVAVFTGWEKINTQLDEYVTRKALDGLFIKVKDEEKQIRKNPAARVTDILERVFGK